MPNQAVANSPERGNIDTQLGSMLRSGRSFSGRERNCAYLNISRSNRSGAANFAPVATVAGFDIPDDGRALALVDWDHDGDLDVWTSNRTAPRLRFLRNDLDGQNQFLLLKLEGNGTSTNRDAVGARVQVTTPAATTELSSAETIPGVSPLSTQTKTVRAGEGFLAQSSSWLHFGLGDASEIDSVVIQWPDGTTESLTNIQPNRRYLVKQGDKKAVLLATSRENLALQPGQAKVPLTSSKTRIPVVSQLPLPEFSYLNSRKHLTRIALNQGQPLLVTLWSKTCRPCLVELKEFGQHASQLRQSGLNILALSVDGAATDSYSAQQATETLERLGYSFEAGGATTRLINMLQAANNFVVTNNRPLPLPTSFLISGTGNLTHIYKGPVTVDRLLRDVQESPGDLNERLRRADLTEGIRVDHPHLQQIVKSTEVNRRWQWANTMEPFLSPLEMFTHYQQVVNLKPDFVEAQNNCGVYLMRAEQLDEAAKAFRQAIAIDPEYWLAHLNLAGVKRRQGKLDQAELILKNWLKIKPNHAPAFCELGMVYFQNGRKSAAEKLFLIAAQISPELGQAYYCLGILQASRGNMIEAESLFQKAVTLSPEDTEARQALTKIRGRRQAN